MSEEVRGLAAMNPEHRERFRTQLRFLKKGVGLTPESAGGGTLRWLKYFGATTALSAYEMLRTALDSLDPRHLHVQALLNAYGGDGLADDIKARRKNFAEKHGLREPRVFHLEDLALEEMVEKLDALAQGKKIEPFKPAAVAPSIEKPSAEDPTVKDLLIGLTKAIKEQTAVLREISAKLDQ